MAYLVHSPIFKTDYFYEITMSRSVFNLIPAPWREYVCTNFVVSEERILLCDFYIQHPIKEKKTREFFEFLETNLIPFSMEFNNLSFHCMESHVEEVFSLAGYQIN